MKKYRLMNLFVAATMLLAGLAGNILPAAAQEAVADNSAEYVPGEVVVVFTGKPTAAQTGARAAALAPAVNANVAAQGNGVSLLSFAEGTDVNAMAEQLAHMPGVAYAEPNYIYRIPEADSVAGARPAPQEYVIRDVKITPKAGGVSTTRQYAVPVPALRNMKKGTGARAAAVYPNDPLLWDNPGWDAVNADILVGNTTIGKNVCVIDTGVDALHPDLKGKIINGRDFVNDDMVPADDNGHGTHVAGIIVALSNNKIGMAGAAPTSKVIAVKALDAFGNGTNYDIAQGIYYCASRTDVSVINMSLSGPYSALLKNAVADATDVRNKIIVAAAGNENAFSFCVNDNGTPGITSDDYADGDVRRYPAGFATAANNYSTDGSCTDLGTVLHPAYPNVISVGATGDWIDTGSYVYYDDRIKAPYSNYGSWVTLLAPGTSILSTLPYDKPFVMQSDGYYPRFDYLSGTSMAAPFASAMFARAWGYKALTAPTITNTTVKAWVISKLYQEVTASHGWPAEQPDTYYTNIAGPMERTAIMGDMIDANTGLAVKGSTLYAYTDTTPAVLKGSAVVTTYTGTNWNVEGQIYTMPASWAEIVNLPATFYYKPRGMMPGYTATATFAFPYYGLPEYGEWQSVGTMAVPPKSVNFSVVTTWDDSSFDLDAIAFLPDVAHKSADGQALNFMVNQWYEGGDIASVDPDGTGAMYVFPFARHFGESALMGWPVESITVKNRIGAGCSLPSNALLPCYGNTTAEEGYEFWVSDSGVYFDLDTPGVEDATDNPALYYFGSMGLLEVYVWKDGYNKFYTYMEDTCAPGEHFWHAFDIDLTYTGTTKPYHDVDQCGTQADFPYGSLPSWWAPAPYEPY
jgi:subtilisin family serine protease